MKRNKKNGFTLVELLAVIVILAIILVIAVPKVMSVIEDSKKATLEATAKMIASAAEKAKVQNTLLGKVEDITCDSVAKINSLDYASCSIEFEDNTAKVSIKGSGKFAGLYVCSGEKTNAIAGNTSCSGVCATDEIKKVYNEYVVDDIPSCVSYVATKLRTVGQTDFASAVEPICNGEEVNGYNFKNAILMLIDLGLFTEEELMENNVMKLGEVKRCVTDWAKIVAAVKSGNHPYEVGDTKTIDMGPLGTHTLRVANTTKCSEVEVPSKTACGFVLEFADVITAHNMNPAGEYNGTQYLNGTNLGGWPASEMRTYVNKTIYNILPEELRTGIIDTYVVSSHGSNTTEGNIENENAGVLEGGNYWSNDKLYLLSPQEVWGTTFTENEDSSNETSRQLDYYEDNGVSTSNYGKTKKLGSVYYWWLRSAYSDDDDNFYCVVGNDSYRGIPTASFTLGVSPAFRLAE